MNTQQDTADTTVNVNSQRVMYPQDYRDSFERSITESPAGRQEIIRNNRRLSPTEEAEDRLESLLALPKSISDMNRQALVCYISGASLVRTSESLAPFGSTGIIIASPLWIGLFTVVFAASRRPCNLLGLVWRLTFMATGGL